MNHVVELRHLLVGVAKQGEVHLHMLGLLDIGDPLVVRRHIINADADRLDVALFELGLEPRDGAKLSRAYRGEVLRMREEDRPFVAEPLMKVDRSLGRVLGKIWRYA